MRSAQKRIELHTGRVGLISDTHGLVRPEALQALKRSELILHAGDIGKPDVLDALRRIAPVIAIRGNNDRDAWAEHIPDRLQLTVNGRKIQLIHDANELGGAPVLGVDAVLSGHSHQPCSVLKHGVLFINPGSAGPRRFKLPVTVGRLQIRAGKIRADIIPLNI